MNRSVIAAASLVVLALFISVAHAANEEYSANLRALEEFFGDGKKTAKLYSGTTQPDAGLAQILAPPEITITAVDGRKVKSKQDRFGYRAYEQLPGTYEFEVTSWRGRSRDHYIGKMWKYDKQAAYPLQVIVEAGQEYVLSPIWNDGEMGMVAPSQVCLQGQSDTPRYCALRPEENDDVFAMDEKHGVIFVGLTGGFLRRVILINLDCDWKSNKLPPRVNTRTPATELRDVCYISFDAEDSKGYILESVDAGVWQWWGLDMEEGQNVMKALWDPGEVELASALMSTITFEVEPGKVNYVGHIGAIRSEKGKLFSFRVADNFSSFEPIISAGFGNSEIVNKAIHYAGFQDSGIEVNKIRD